MPRVGAIYALATRTGESVHESDTSTGTGNKKTITKPPGATAMILSAKTTNVRVTFDGTDPGAGVAPGLIIVAGSQPVLLPFATDLEFVSDSAAASELNVLWLE